MSSPPADQASPAPLRKSVFVAYSYRHYPKDDYRRVYRSLEEKYDVTFIFADEKITNMHIMKKIESFIRQSDFSIFDITGWNPNVTLELGFAMAAGDQWYIAIDPSKTEVAEVPSDLRGLDRIQYGSYTEFEEKLSILLEQRYPKRPRQSIDGYLEGRREEVRQVLISHPGLTTNELSQLMKEEVGVVQLILRPLLESGELETVGIKRWTRYYPKGKTPKSQAAQKDLDGSDYIG